MSQEMKRITVLVRNMTCANCELIIERELSRLDGILGVEASYGTGIVKIIYNELFVSPEEILSKLEEHDYQGEIVTEGSKISEIPPLDKSPREPRRKEKVSPPTDYTNIVALLILLFAGYMIANRFGLWNIFNRFPLAKEGMGYGMLFVIGLLTSVHCIAMCGGICLSQCAPVSNGNSNQISRFAAIRPSLLYNLGRVISYTVIGALVGALGSVISFSGTTKGFVQLLAGVFMVSMGLNMLNLFPGLRRFNPRIPKAFARKINAQRSRSNSPLYIGLLNGLMPCGPLQAMQLYALSTGSPVKGAVAMFLFSIGTVPLMFLFGALGSFLNKRFAGRMMKVSAVLVVTLGVFMLGNGLSLSGIGLPSISSFTSQANASTANIANIQDGVQTVTVGLSSGRYEPIIVQKGIPVKWIIQAKDGEINGCNNSIVVPKYNLQKDLQVGDNVIEFTPKESGTVPYSCWMGMIRSQITVVDDLNKVDQTTISENNSASISGAGGSCCSGADSRSNSGSSNNNSSSGNAQNGAKNFSSGAVGSCCR